VEIVAIIPARGGSKGVPRKNIRDLNGKPLIAYTIEEALKSSYINKIIVSTDDEEVAEVSRKYGAEVPFLRPDELSCDNSPSIDAIIHAVNWLKENRNYIPDYVCLLQCTTPLRRVEHIDGTIKKLFATSMDGAVSVCEAEVNPYWTNVFDGDRLTYFIPEGRKILRRQDLPKIYRINGVVYIIKTSVLLEERSLEAKNMTGYVMDAEDSIDIDTIMDFKYAEMIMKERNYK